jgi:hypothetical protein
MIMDHGFEYGSLLSKKEKWGFVECGRGTNQMESLIHYTFIPKVGNYKESNKLENVLVEENKVCQYKRIQIRLYSWVRSQSLKYMFVLESLETDFSSANLME